MTPEALRDRGRRHDHAGRDRRSRGVAGVRRRPRARRASRSTTPGSCRSCRRRRPKPRSCSTWSSERRASTPARGSRVAGRSSPRTRRCVGSPTSPACPPSAGGVFVSGGTAGNLSALIAARWRWRHRADGAPRSDPWPDGGVGRGSLVGRPSGPSDGRRRRARARRRSRGDDRAALANRARRTRPARSRSTLRHRGDGGHDQRRGRRRSRGRR